MEHDSSSSDDELELEENPAASSSEDELQLEGNSDDGNESLQLEGNIGADESDESLRLEANSDGGGDDSDNLSLQLEENDLQLEEPNDDAEKLELEVNVGDTTLEDATGGDSDSSDDTLGWKKLLPARTTVLEGHAGPSAGLDGVETLTLPPDLPPLPADESLDRVLPQRRAAANPGTALMQAVGVVGSHRPPKTPMVDELAREGSTSEEGLHPSKHSHVLDLCHRTMVFHTSRLLADSQWGESYARVAEAICARARAGGDSSPPRVCVIGLGSGVPALAAARAGAEVVWVERVARFVDVARRLARTNGLADRVTVVRVTEWGDLSEMVNARQDGAGGGGGGGGWRATGGNAPPPPRTGSDYVLRRHSFDAVLTEEVDDSLLAEGVVDIGRVARTALLKVPMPLAAAGGDGGGTGGGMGGGTGGGSFAPHGATLRAMLLSVRTTQVSGFDLRGFNAFAAGRAFVSDIGEVEAKEGGVCTRMSEPYTLCSLGFAPSQEAMEEAARAAALHFDAAASDQATAAAEGPTHGTVAMTATASGVFNCIAVWYELHLTDEVSIDLGPSAASPGSWAPADTPAAAAAAAAATAAGFPPGLTSSRAHATGGAPLPYTMRARAQRLHFLGYERRLGAGQTVRVAFHRGKTQLDVACELEEAEAAAMEARGDLVRWPTRNSLGYHFSMIADTTRNGCFDRAIIAALASRPEVSLCHPNSGAFPCSCLLVSRSDFESWRGSWCVRRLVRAALGACGAWCGSWGTMCSTLAVAPGCLR